MCTQSRLYETTRVEQAGQFGALDPLLDLAQLTEPKLTPEDGELGGYCTAQWLVFRSDLVRAGIIDSDAGVAMPDPDAGVADAGATGDADVADDASSPMDASEPSGSTGGSCDCSMVRARDRTSTHTRAWVVGVAVLVLYVRHRRAHAR